MNIPAQRTAQVCVGHHKHEPERPRQASHGLLCTGCYLRLEQTLAELPAAYDELAHNLAGKGHGGDLTDEDQQWPLAIADVPLPIRTAIADHRGHMHGLLMSWARLVSEEAEQGAPTHHGVNDLAAWLGVRLDWIVCQMWVDEMAKEINEASTRAHNLLQPSGRRRLTIAPCPEADCDGDLTAVVGDADDLLPAVITCSEDAEHAWSSADWQKLGKRLGRQAYDQDAVAELLRCIG